MFVIFLNPTVSRVHNPEECATGIDPALAEIPTLRHAQLVIRGKFGFFAISGNYTLNRS